MMRFVEWTGNGRRRGWRAVVLGSLLAVPLIGCGEGEKQAAQPEAPPPAVIVATAERRTVTEQDEYVGRVVAVDRVDLRARVEGFLERRLFEEGQTVKEGDLLFVIEKAPFEAVVEARKADVTRAQAEAKNARLQLDRALALVKNKNIAEATVDQRRADFLTADASIQQADAQLREAEINLSYTDVTAPIAGRIGLAKYTVGNLVGPASGVIATIVRQDPMYVTFPVSAREILDFRRRAIEGTVSRDKLTVKLMLADGSEYKAPGTINFLDVLVDEGTDTQTVRAEFPNPDGLLTDGQFGRVIVETGKSEEAVVIPQVALQVDQAGPFVLIVDDQNKVQVRRVAIGQSREGMAAVSDGLTGGERVVTEGVQKVRPGQTVQPSAATSQGA